MADENQGERRPMERKVAEASDPVTGTDTVCVAIKHPNGIVLQAYEMRPSRSVTPNGYLEEKVAVAVGDSFTLHGAAVDVNAVLSGRMPAHLIINGFAITPGVPRDLWRAWAEDNKDSRMVKAGLIFMAKDEAEARSIALERGHLRSGLEPIDPNNPGEKTGMKFIEQGARTAA